MPLVNMRDMLQHAYKNGYAVGGFDLVSLDFLEAIMAGATPTEIPLGLRHLVHQHMLTDHYVSYGVTI